MVIESTKYIRVSSGESSRRKRVVGYIRVSGDKQSKTRSEDEQRIAISDYCSAMGWDLNEIYVDEGHPARGEEPETRPEYLRMMSAVEEGRYDIVVTYTLDRISRDLIRMFDTIKAFGRCGISFVSIREDLDLSGSMGQVLLALFSTLAEMKYEIIRYHEEESRN